MKIEHRKIRSSLDLLSMFYFGLENYIYVVDCCCRRNFHTKTNNANCEIRHQFPMIKNVSSMPAVAELIKELTNNKSAIAD
jgi:hypothetical protein